MPDLETSGDSDDGNRCGNDSIGFVLDGYSSFSDRSLPNPEILQRDLASAIGG